ncbi:MAG: HAD family hydrolase [Deltaproteobacteria bacterium]|nr:HAD family hydrolase [Deltaproteobacteria bacterium]
MDLTIYRSAIFDCDGVILDSNGMKSRAFRQALEGEEPELIDQFIRYHQENGGVSRTIKFRHFYQVMKEEKDFEKKAEATMRRYSELAKQGLLRCPEIPGIRKLLDHLYVQGASLFVVSGGDEEEVLSVFEARNLLRYFKKILGSPKTKNENMALLEKERLIHRPAVYFGDSAADLEAAEAFGLDFVFVASRSEWRDGRDKIAAKRLPAIEDFSNL